MFEGTAASLANTSFFAGYDRKVRDNYVAGFEAGISFQASSARTAKWRATSCSDSCDAPLDSLGRRNPGDAVEPIAGDLEILSEYYVRGRLGYDLNEIITDTLVYGTFGFVNYWTNREVPNFAEESQSMNGYSYGLGIETALAERITGRLEYSGATFPEREPSTRLGLGIAYQF